jgi:hypothetical protein
MVCAFIRPLMSLPATDILSAQGRRWVWHEQWLELPVPERGVRNLRTHGIDVLRNGRIVLFHQAVPAVLLFAPEGKLLSRFGQYPGAHGLTLVERDGEELLWLTDEALGLVELVDLQGRVQQRLEKPVHPAYEKFTFAPTWVAEESVEGAPVRLWVADGYGSMLVHAYDGEGRYEFSLDGTAGAGKFDYPHGLAIDPRPGKNGRLLVADRANRRVQEFARDGTFLGSWGEDFLSYPNGFDFRGGQCVLSELFGRVTIVDSDNRPVDFLGDQPNARFLPGWPQVNPEQMLQPGLFNSPHHAAWGPDGEIHVVEWIKHGRVTKLVPAG